MKGKNIVAILIVILGVVMLLIPQFIAPVCPIHDGHIMKCHWMGQAVVGLGALIGLLGLLMLVVKDKKMAAAFSISAALVSGLAIAVSTHLIGGCSHHHMSCQMHTIPVVTIVGGILVVLGLGYPLYERFKK